MQNKHALGSQQTFQDHLRPIFNFLPQFVCMLACNMLRLWTHLSFKLLIELSMVRCFALEIISLIGLDKKTLKYSIYKDECQRRKVCLIHLCQVESFNPETWSCARSTIVNTGQYSKPDSRLTFWDAFQTYLPTLGLNVNQIEFRAKAGQRG